MNANFGERIRRARRAAGINQSELARQIGVSRASVSLWENGGIGELTGENLLRVAKALAVDVEYIQHGKGEDPTGVVWNDARARVAAETRKPEEPKEVSRKSALKGLIVDMIDQLGEEATLELLVHLHKITKS